LIPISLTFKGLYSYQRETNIDFANLTNSHLFGIFGPVGSGKSTILEAIMFALYGEIERLHQRDNRGYNMMNLKAKDLLIDFIFRSGAEEYRFIVKGKRNKNQFIKTSTPERTAYQKINQEWVPQDYSTAEEILGLSYKNFKRTIIIPQGRFHEFLTLTETDRTRMLKEIFALDKYEFFVQVAGLEKKNNAKLQELSGQLQQIGDINLAVIAETKKELKKVERVLAVQDKELKIKLKAEKKFDLLKEIFIKINKLQNKVRELEKEESFFQTQKKKLNRYETCRNNFGDLLVQKEEIVRTITQTELDLGQKKNKLNSGQEKLKQEEIKFARAQKQYLGKEELVKKGEDLKKIIVMKKLKGEIESRQERIIKGEKTVREAKDIIVGLKSQKAAVSDYILEKKQNLKSLTDINEVKEWFTHRQYLVQNTEKILKERETLEQEIKLLEQQKQEALVNELLIEALGQNRGKQLSFDEINERLNQFKLRQEQASDDLSQQIDHLKVREKLKEFAADLKKGKPCPLCGSKTHQKIFKPEAAWQELPIRQTEKSLLLTKIKRIDQAMAQIGKIKILFENKIVGLKSVQIELEVVQEKIKVHQQEFVWPQFKIDDESEVLRALEKQKILEREKNSREEELKKIEQQLELTQGKNEKYEQVLQEIKKEYVTFKTKYEMLHSQVTGEGVENYQSQKIEQLESELNQLRQEYLGVEKQYLILEKNITQSRSAVNAWQGEIGAEEKMLSKTKKLEQEVDQKLGQRIQKWGYKDLAEIKQLLAEKIDVAKWQKEINTFEQEFNMAQEQLKQSTKELQGEEYDPNKHQELVLAINIEQKKNQEGYQHRGELKREIENYQQKLEQKKVIEQETQKLEKRAVNIATLKNIFLKSGFVNYVSTIYLQNLCQAANDRFYRLTRQKYRLEVDDNNNFVVRDYLNDGQVRSIKTLSGGQMFQAALSLALALADNVQKLNQAQPNFFFLDEGFGSLDKESLHIVFETLKALRKENRIVGVISHVEELQQEIPVFLKIHNEEVGGSRVVESWQGGRE
jgi:exonuclease SbcC